MVKYKGRGLVVKTSGVLSKVQMLNRVLGVGVFSLLPIVWGAGAFCIFRIIAVLHSNPQLDSSDLDSYFRIALHGKAKLTWVCSRHAG